MGINIRQKGATGEREVIDLCTPIVREVYADLGIPFPETPPLQRNQNQTAVGGSDITNPFKLSIEVKRQEALSVNTWWTQCETSATKAQEFPVLLWRQNGKKWKAMMYADLRLPASGGAITTHMRARVTMELVEFLAWFKQWVKGMNT
jgi:hypothetical protein